MPLYSYVPYLAGILCLLLDSPADLCCLLQLTQIPLYINYATIFDYRKFSSIFFFLQTFEWNRSRRELRRKVL